MTIRWNNVLGKWCGPILIAVCYRCYEYFIHLKYTIEKNILRCSCYIQERKYKIHSFRCLLYFFKLLEHTKLTIAGSLAAFFLCMYSLDLFFIKRTERAKENERRRYVRLFAFIKNACSQNLSVVVAARQYIKIPRPRIYLHSTYTFVNTYFCNMIFLAFPILPTQNCISTTPINRSAQDRRISG